MLVTMSAILSNGVSEIVARLAIGKMLLFISLIPNPAIAKYLVAPATSVVVNLVLTPTLRTFLPISAKRSPKVSASLSVACNMLRTVTIVFSYWEKSFTIEPIPYPAASVPIVPSVEPNIVLRPIPRVPLLYKGNFSLVAPT